MPVIDTIKRRAWKPHVQNVRVKCNNGWMSKEDKSVHVDRGAGRARVVGNNCKCDTTIFLLTAALS
jgi:hypothetical protein